MESGQNTANHSFQLLNQTGNQMIIVSEEAESELSAPNSLDQLDIVSEGGGEEGPDDNDDHANDEVLSQEQQEQQELNDYIGEVEVQPTPITRH